LLIVNKRETTATEAVERLRGMFLDVPGTRLSVADAARLSGVEPSLSGGVLKPAGDVFLEARTDGTFTVR
jgi:hypothetical protein